LTAFYIGDVIVTIGRTERELYLLSEILLGVTEIRPLKRSSILYMMKLDN